MAKCGKFQVRSETLVDNTVVYDVVFESFGMANEITTLVYNARDEHDAQMRCERLNGSITSEQTP
jgi:hypothetical protein